MLYPEVWTPQATFPTSAMHNRMRMLSIYCNSMRIKHEIEQKTYEVKTYQVQNKADNKHDKSKTSLISWKISLLSQKISIFK